MDKTFFNVSFSILIGLFTIFALSFTGFIFHIPINIFYPLIGFAAFNITFYLLSKKDNIETKKIIKIQIGLNLVIFILTILLSTIMDSSYDGRSYHQLAMIFFKNGWNPIYETSKSFLQTYCTMCNNTGGLIWAENYPKFTEILASNIYILTGKIESGKILNYLTFIALYTYGVYVLGKFSKTKWLIHTCAFLLALNPVLIVQLNTFYSDGLLGAYCLIAILSIIHQEVTPPRNSSYSLDSAILILSSIIMLNIKLGGFLYLAVIFLCYSIYLIIKKELSKLKILGISLVLIIIVALISGINPYFTNMQHRRNPFYPLAGRHKIDIMTGNTHYQLQKKSMPYKFFYSTFSRMNNKRLLLSKNERLELKLPFDFTKDKFDGVPDTRISGFGTLWGGILLLTIIQLIFMRHKDKKIRNIFILTSSIIISSVLLNPENWWARYVPILYSFPVFTAFFSIISLNENTTYKQKLISYILILLVLVNSLIFIPPTLSKSMNYTKKCNENIKELKKKNRQVYIVNEISYLEKLNEKHVNYKLISKNEFLKNKKDFHKYNNTIGEIWWK